MSHKRRFSIISGIGIAALTALCLTFTAAEAVKPGRSSNAEPEWQKTFQLIRGHQEPVARKLLTWIYATAADLPVDAHELMRFINANPNWPRLHVMRIKVEEEIANDAAPADIISWFLSSPPTTHDGIKAYMDALLRMGRKDEARLALAKFWAEAELSKNKTASLAGSYKPYFSPVAHIVRLDNLIWAGRLEEAEYMLAFVDSDTRALGHARIELAKLSKRADAALQAVPPKLLNDQGLLFERLRYRRRKNMEAGAMEIVSQMPQVLIRPDLWWQELNVLARRKIEERDFKSAYAIASKHRLKEGPDYAQAEWLLGWLDLRYLKNPAQAYAHFSGLFDKVQSAISKSRAAYWSARAAEAQGDKLKATEWDRKSAQYISSFYGQLSAHKLGMQPNPAALKLPPADPVTAQAFSSNELVHAVHLLKKTGMMKLSDPFFAKLLDLAKSPAEFDLIAKLARETGRPYYAVQANKDIQQKLGGFLLVEGYPALPALPLANPEKALVHAITHRESMFNPEAESTAGAKGLMQLMPGTAKAVSRQQGLNYRLDKLISDPRYNVQLGSAYLQQMLNRFDGFYPMAIAAYNAGPGRVDQWIDEFGDPRNGSVDLIDWIENIPIYETRNYVQRVMESYYMYKLRFSEKPKTVLDFIR